LIKACFLSVPYFPAFVNEPCTLYFGVKFYAADPNKIKEEVTRYQFFLQLKQDLFTSKLTCSWKKAAELSALAIQCELPGCRIYCIRLFAYFYSSRSGVQNLPLSMQPSIKIYASVHMSCKICYGVRVVKNSVHCMRMFRKKT